MGKLTGGVYSTFEKPYLEQVADVIKSGKQLKIANKMQQVNMTDEIKSYIDLVEKKDERKLSLLLRNGGSKFSPIFNGYKWTDIDKSQFTGLGNAPSGESTAMQERASLFAIQKSIENNGFTNQKKFYELYRNDLLKIYPDMDEEWEDTFFQQQLTVYREVGNTRYKHYSRDKGMMEYMTKIAKDMYGISQKDSWNPADIWLVSDYNKVVAFLEKKLKDDVTSIQEFNAILREMWHDRKCIGISLKKMSGKKALWELVNLEDMDMFDNDEYKFELVSAAVDFSLKNDLDFKTSDSIIVLKSKKQSISFQIRQNSKGFNNLKIEGTDMSARSARLGKVPLPMVSNLLASENIVFDNSNRNYPRSADEFNEPYTQSKFVKQWESVKQYTNVKTKQQFIDNVNAVYMSTRKDYAHSKLMQLDLFSKLFTKPKDKQETLLTSMAFLAQKKGKVFGPFGKLY